MESSQRLPAWAFGARRSARTLKAASDSSESISTKSKRQRWVQHNSARQCWFGISQIIRCSGQNQVCWRVCSILLFMEEDGAPRSVCEQGSIREEEVQFKSVLGGCHGQVGFQLSRPLQSINFVIRLGISRRTAVQTETGALRRTSTIPIHCFSPIPNTDYEVIHQQPPTAAKNPHLREELTLRTSRCQHF